MAYIKKKSERKFKITVCNGYKVNGQKRMKAQTITVPSSVPKRGIQQYVMAEAERIEKKFKYGVEESDQTHFEQYAENWLKRQQPFFKATTYAGYKRNLDIVYPLIGGIPLRNLEHHPVFAPNCKGADSTFTCRVVNRDLSVAQEHSQLLFLVQAVSQSITGFLAANLQRVLLFYPCEISLYQADNTYSHHSRWDLLPPG